MQSSINLRTDESAVSVEQKNHDRALRLLSLTIFLLMADPLMNIYIGPVPVYAIDFLAFLTWMNANRVPSTRRYPLQGFVFLILIAMLMSELIAGLQLGTLLQPVYLIGRTLLAISLFFSTARIIQSKSDLETLLKAALPGAFITAALMVTSSLPQTQGLVARLVFSHSFLLPSADNIAARYGFGGIALRGQSLVGVSILSAAFQNTIWPLLFLLRAEGRLGARWKTVMLSAIVLVPMGIIMSYSRGAIGGLVVIVTIVLLLNSSKVRQPVVIGVGVTILIFSWVGWGSEYFRFEWLQEKVEDQFANPFQSYDMTQRIYAYSEPFELVRRNPSFLIVGQGFARVKIAGASWEGASVHAVFAAATYGYGMVAAFAYIFLLLGAFRLTWRYAWRSTDNFARMFSRALLASLFGFSSWFLLGPAAVSEPRGAMLLFFIFGLVTAQSNIAGLPETERHRIVSYREFRNVRAPR